MVAKLAPLVRTPRVDTVRPYDSGMHHGDSRGEYLIVWRYEVGKEALVAFEQTYGPHGPWVALFATAPGYRGTELVRGGDLGEYLTIDRWESRELYDTFRSDRALDYKRLDAECDALTESETLVFEGTVIAP
jgi:heme-degrading monooxygenase HmoA